MIYAVQIDDTIIVSAASTLEEFEDFKAADHEFEGATAEIADILEMMTNPNLKGYRAAPLVITCQDRDAANTIISDHMLHLQSIRESRDTHEAMLEHARLEQELGKPIDRRTLGEIHGLDEFDPWKKEQSDEAKASHQKQSEQMKKVREAGGITGDSFDGALGEGVNVHSANVTVDDKGNVTNVSVMATKSTLSAYEITVPKATDFDIIFNELRIPENRVEEQDETRAVIRLHDFQLKQIANVFENHRIVYTITRMVEEGEGDQTKNIIEGHDDLYLFFSVQIGNALIANMLPIIDAANIDQSVILAMHDFEDSCWFVCANESHAEEISQAIDAAGHANTIVAVNRRGQAILGVGADARIVDTNKKIVTDPRPWNDRAAEIDAMSDDDREKLMKSIKASEFIFVIRDHPKYRTVVQITPETYFRENNVMWEGEMPILALVPEKFLTHVEGNTYACSYDLDLAKANMCRFGFNESLLMQLHVNELMSIQLAERAL